MLRKDILVLQVREELDRLRERLLDVGVRHPISAFLLGEHAVAERRDELRVRVFPDILVVGEDIMVRGSESNYSEQVDSSHTMSAVPRGT